MVEAAHASANSGGADIHQQQETFHHFLTFALWATLLLVMAVGLLTVSFAMGFGWFIGVGLFAAIGVIAALALNLGGAWWAMVIASSLLMGLGGTLSLLFHH